MKTKGICYLVGAGPGDPGLLTLRGRECLEQADVVLYDYLVSPSILRWASPSARVRYVGKTAGRHTLPQEDVNALLVKETRAGHRVVRLKGGDPFVFGRGGEEALALAAAKLPFEIVPGISSAIAGPAYAGIPVTHRGMSAAFTVFTGHEDPSKDEPVLDYAHIAQTHGTKVILMGVERAGAIAAALVSEGMPGGTPVALIRWATTGRQQTLCATLDTVADRVREAGFQSPAVTVIGEVVTLRDSLQWFEHRPLLGQRIVVTRARKQSGGLSDALIGLGADVIELPTIRIDPAPEPMEFGRLVRDSHTYAWIVFTSVNGVDAFFEYFYKIYDDAREIGGVRIAAIGPATARRVRDFHLKVDVQPEDFVAEALVKALKKEGGIENETFLIVRPAEARDTLPQELSAAGAIVDVAVAYRTMPETEDPTGARARLETEGADWIAFTSASTVRNFLALNLARPPAMKVASIGPVTSATLREAGWTADVEASKHDIPGLVAAILRKAAVNP